MKITDEQKQKIKDILHYNTFPITRWDSYVNTNSLSIVELICGILESESSNKEVWQSHDWFKGETIVHGEGGGNKFTKFTCKKCNAYFRHFYDLYPDIHEASYKYGITVCNK